MATNTRIHGFLNMSEDQFSHLSLPAQSAAVEDLYCFASRQAYGIIRNEPMELEDQRRLYKDVEELLNSGTYLGQYRNITRWLSGNAKQVSA